MATSRRRSPAASDDPRLIRDWMRAHPLLRLGLGYDERTDRILAIVTDLSRDGAYVGDGGASDSLVEAMLAAIDSAERAL